MKTQSEQPTDTENSAAPQSLHLVAPAVVGTSDTDAAQGPPKDSLSIKLPPFLRAALDREAARWGQTAPEFMRSLLIFAMRQPEGVRLNLPDSEPQPELFPR